MSAVDRNALWGTRAICVVLSAQLGGAACRADSAPPLDREAFVRCAAMSAENRRLACYDALAADLGLHATARTAPPVVADEKRFGLSKPLEPVERSPESLAAKVVRVSEDSIGNVSVTLDNDQVWQFNDGHSLLRPGDPVVIKRAALGSFIMTAPGRRAYRVRRIR